MAASLYMSVRNLSFFTVTRIVLGVFLIYYFLALLPYAGEILSADGVYSDLPSFLLLADYLNQSSYLRSVTFNWIWPTLAAILAVLFTAGILRRATAFILWVAWGSIFFLNPLVSHPGYPFIGWLLLAFAALPDRSHPQFKPLLRLATVGGWLIMATAYTISGIDKLQAGISWRNGEAIPILLSSPLARDNFLVSFLAGLPEQVLALSTYGVLWLEVLALATLLFRHSRVLFWWAMTAVHLGILLTVALAEISISMLIFHLFLWPHSTEIKRFQLPGGLLLQAWHSTVIYVKKHLSTSALINCVFAVLIGLLWGQAFRETGSPAGVALGLSIGLLIPYLLYSPHTSYFSILLLSLVGHARAFSWTAEAVQTFTEMGPLGSLFTTALLFLFASLQFLLFYWLFLRLDRFSFANLSLSIPLAWAIVELSFYRPLPWYHGQTVLAATPLAQSAEFIGPVLISFLLFWWGQLIYTLFSRSSTRRLTAGLLISSVIVVFGWGVSRLSQIDARVADRTLSVGFVQGNLPPAHVISYGDDRWLESQEYYCQEMMALEGKGADLIILPETSYPSLVREDLTEIENFCPQVSTPYLINAPELITKHGMYQFFRNSIFYVGEDGSIAGTFSKVLPFPFAEALPFQDSLGILKAIQEKNKVVFVPDRRPAPLSLDQISSELNILPLVCFESVEGQHVAGLTRLSSHPATLVEMSNHGWFGKSLVSEQHLLLAVWRSIETRLPLLRVSNAGASSFTDSSGRTHLLFPPGRAGSDIIELDFFVPDSLYLPGLFSLLKYLAWLVLFAFLLRGIIKLLKRAGY